MENNIYMFSLSISPSKPHIFSHYHTHALSLLFLSLFEMLTRVGLYGFLRLNGRIYELFVEDSVVAGSCDLL